jgi:peptidoglycan/LPS O-acetylase OafA/YrhL
MSTAARRYDLDALRVGAFLLLILYHLGMFYVPWGWHVKSTYVVPALETPMGLLNPWRLTLLFVISGVATRLMMDKMSVGDFMRRRSLRLLVPLLFGMAVIVPPQSWAEVVEKAGYTGSYLDFWPRYLAFDQGFGIILPTYNHLWFVAYLWLYTMGAALLSPLSTALDRSLGRILGGPAVFLLPTVVFGVLRAFVFPAWGETHIIWADPYLHLHSAFAFLLGLLLARQDAAWALLARARHASLAATIAIVMVGVPLSWIMEDQPGLPGAAFAFIREAYAWGVIATLFGYAHRHIRTGSPLLTTLTEAVFPFYIVHQTAIILAGHFLKPARLPIWAEAAAILAATGVACIGAYALARVVPTMGLLLGLSVRKR